LSDVKKQVSNRFSVWHEIACLVGWPNSSPRSPYQASSPVQNGTIRRRGTGSSGKSARCQNENMLIARRFSISLHFGTGRETTRAIRRRMS
jgi:hypothetical protein